MTLRSLAAAIDPAARRPAPGFTGPIEGTVVAVVAEGVKFTVDGWSADLALGPAKWARHTVGGVQVDPPTAGQTCLVVFAGPGTQRPWVLAWF